MCLDQRFSFVFGVLGPGVWAWIIWSRDIWFVTYSGTLVWGNSEYTMKDMQQVEMNPES